MSGTIDPSAAECAAADALATGSDTVGLGTVIVSDLGCDTKTRQAAREKAIMASNLDMFLHSSALLGSA
jgi:alpha-D-ribose 1-methylphosphonate 5-triphosphate synthase subunit PhnG